MHDPAEPITAPLAASASEQSCQCCGTALVGTYCANCGQNGTVRRLEFRRLFGEVLDHVFSLDAALPRTLRELTVDPGGVARRYVAGRRKLYVNPFKYCLAVTALYFLWNQLIGFDYVPPEAFADLDPQKAKVVGAALSLVIANLNNLFFLILPVYAGVLRLLFRSAGFNYAENYAFVLFVTGHAFLLSMPFSFLGELWPELRVAVRVVVHSVFFVFAAVVFYDRRSVAGVLRALLGQVLYMVVVFAFVFLLTAIFIFVQLQNGSV